MNIRIEKRDSFTIGGYLIETLATMNPTMQKAWICGVNTKNH